MSKNYYILISLFSRTKNIRFQSALATGNILAKT